jgi:hypothetical protein
MEHIVLLDNHGGTPAGESRRIRVDIRDVSGARPAIDFRPDRDQSRDMHGGYSAVSLDGRLYEPVTPYYSGESRLDVLLVNGVRKMTPAEQEAHGKGSDITDTEYGQLVRDLAGMLVCVDGQVMAPSMGPVLVLGIQYRSDFDPRTSRSLSLHWEPTTTALTRNSARRGLFRFDRVEDAYRCLAAAGLDGEAIERRRVPRPDTAPAQDLELPDDMDIRTEAIACSLNEELGNLEIERMSRELLKAHVEMRQSIRHLYPGDPQDGGAQARPYRDLFGVFRGLPSASLTRPLSTAVRCVGEMLDAGRLPPMGMLSRAYAGATVLAAAGFTPEDDDALLFEGFSL